MPAVLGIGQLYFSPCYFNFKTGTIDGGAEVIEMSIHQTMGDGSIVLNNHSHILQKDQSVECCVQHWLTSLPVVSIKMVEGRKHFASLNLIRCRRPGNQKRLNNVNSPFCVGTFDWRILSRYFKKQNKNRFTLLRHHGFESHFRIDFENSLLSDILRSYRYSIIFLWSSFFLDAVLHHQEFNSH